MADEQLRRLGGGRWQTKDQRFTIEPQSGTWVVVDAQQQDDLGMPLVRGPFGSLTDARVAIADAREEPEPASPLAGRERPPAKDREAGAARTGPRLGTLPFAPSSGRAMKAAREPAMPTGDGAPTAKEAPTAKAAATAGSGAGVTTKTATKAGPGVGAGTASGAATKAGTTAKAGGGAGAGADAGAEARAGTGTEAPTDGHPEAPADAGGTRVATRQRSGRPAADLLPSAPSAGGSSRDRDPIGDPDWLLALPSGQRSGARALIRRLEEAGLADASAIARAELEEDVPAIARAALLRRIRALLAGDDDPDRQAAALLALVSAGEDASLEVRWRLVDGDDRPFGPTGDG